MISKRGALGGGVLMIARILLLAFIAFVIFGISAIFYSHYINVRASEAGIVGRNVVDCLASNGVFDFDSYPEDRFDEVLSYCGFDESNLNSVFVRVIFSEGDDAPPQVPSVEGKIATLQQGDSGALWILKIYEDGGVKTGADIRKYRPGHFRRSYPVFVKMAGVDVDASMDVEVLLKYD